MEFNLSFTFVWNDMSFCFSRQLGFESFDYISLNSWMREYCQYPVPWPSVVDINGIGHAVTGGTQEFFLNYNPGEKQTVARFMPY